MPQSPVDMLRQKLCEGRATLGFWVTLTSPTITELACRMGFDWIVIDAEHGSLDFGDIAEHLRVANLLRTVSFVHIAEIRQDLITRMLDLGADGVFLPQVRSVQDVIDGVRFAKYPPQGTRGLAAERATRWGRAMRSKVQSANQQTMIIPMIETVEAAETLDDILAVPGIDAVLFGPADFSSSAGFPGEWEGPGVAERIHSLKQRIRQRMVPCAVMARDPSDAKRRMTEGFQMIGLGSDTGLLVRAATEALHGVGADVPATAWD